jgi:nicotinamidase/pyrazinamidase
MSGNVQELMLVGPETDFCVVHTARDAWKLGYAVPVLEAGCRGVDRGGSLTSAWAQMAEAGVRCG